MIDKDNKYQAAVSQKIFAGAKKVRASGTATTQPYLLGKAGQKWQPLRTNLLDHVDEYKSANVLLSVSPPRDKIIVRGEKSVLATAIKKTINLAMPNPLHYSMNKNTRLSWVSPDEWLIDIPLGKAKEVMENLQSALGKKHHGLIDVSDYYVSIGLKGAAGILLINKGSPFNTDERFFATGNVVSTHYSNASILLTYLDGGWEFQVRSSFAPYLWYYLVTAAKEFG